MEWYQGDLQKAIAAEDWPKVKKKVEHYLAFGLLGCWGTDSFFFAVD